MLEIAIHNLDKPLIVSETTIFPVGNIISIKNPIVGSAVILSDNMKEKIIDTLGEISEYNILSSSTPEYLEISKTDIEIPFHVENSLFSNNTGIHVDVEQEIEMELD